MAIPDKGNQKRGERKGGSATERLKNLRSSLGKEPPASGVADSRAPRETPPKSAPRSPVAEAAGQRVAAREPVAQSRPAPTRGTLVRSMMARMDADPRPTAEPTRSAVVERKPKQRGPQEQTRRPTVQSEGAPRSSMPRPADVTPRPRRATQPQLGEQAETLPRPVPPSPNTTPSEPRDTRETPSVGERLSRVADAASRGSVADAAPVDPPIAGSRATRPAPDARPVTATSPASAKRAPSVAPSDEKPRRQPVAPPPLKAANAEIDPWSGVAKVASPDAVALPHGPSTVAAPGRSFDDLEPQKTPPFAGFEWNIASRYLRARRKEGFISVIAGFSLVGIALGVATLIIVMSVMTGFRETLIDQILGVDPHINVVTQQDRPFDDYDPMAQALRGVEGVTRVWPSVEGQVLASSATAHSGVIVRGVRRADMRNLKIVTEPEASVGSVENFVEDNGVAIGEGVARKLGLRLGDSVTLVSPDGDLTPFGVTPRSKSYPVLYIYKLGLNHYDSAFIYMPMEEAQLYFNKKGVVDSLNVLSANASEIEELEQPIRQAAKRSIGVLTWKDRQGSLIGALDVERNVMFLILTLIILVAALNIISGLVMLVKDKARDVAIMRTMGMSRGSVLRIFFICGASIGVVGAVVGTVLGVLFCLNIGAIQAAVETVTGPVFPAEVYGLSGLPARLQTGDVFLTLGIALTLSFLATLYPAWKAAKLDPVEALRYD